MEHTNLIPCPVCGGEGKTCTTCGNTGYCPPVAEWALFTKRTDDPKLTWLEGQLDAAGVPYRRNGESFHAPILEVPKDRLDDAWACLPLDIDNLPDDHEMFLSRCEAS